MNPWDNPENFFQGEYLGLKRRYYEGLNLRFETPPPDDRMEYGVRYVIEIGSRLPVVKPVNGIVYAEFVPVRFRVRLHGTCPNEWVDDCYHKEGHPETVGESTIDFPVKMLPPQKR